MDTCCNCSSCFTAQVKHYKIVVDCSTVDINSSTESSHLSKANTIYLD